MSYSASTIGLPVLRHSSSARAAAFCRIFSASLKKIRPRSCALVCGHGPESNASLRSFYRAVNIRGVGGGDLRDNFFGGGIVNRKCFSGRARTHLPFTKF